MQYYGHTYCVYHIEMWWFLNEYSYCKIKKQWIILMAP